MPVLAFLRLWRDMPAMENVAQSGDAHTTSGRPNAQDVRRFQELDVGVEVGGQRFVPLHREHLVAPLFERLADGARSAEQFEHFHKHSPFAKRNAPALPPRRSIDRFRFAGDEAHLARRGVRPHRSNSFFFSARSGS